MLNDILKLDGIAVLSKEQQMHIIGGDRGIGSGTDDGNTCKATCKDGSLVTVSGCSDAAVGCSTSGGSQSCKCDYPGPFDPPGGGYTNP